MCVWVNKLTSHLFSLLSNNTNIDSLGSLFFEKLKEQLEATFVRGGEGGFKESQPLRSYNLIVPRTPWNFRF